MKFGISLSVHHEANLRVHSAATCPATQCYIDFSRRTPGLVDRQLRQPPYRAAMAAGRHLRPHQERHGAQKKMRASTHKMRFRLHSVLPREGHLIEACAVRLVQMCCLGHQRVVWVGIAQ